MDGCPVRNSDSTQPVHSWPESQITGGRFGEVTASAIRGTAAAGKPMVAATAVQNFMKSLRVTLLNRFSLLPTTFDFICHLLNVQVTAYVRIELTNLSLTKP
jgi:hypothetical protein